MTARSFFVCSLILVSLCVQVTQAQEPPSPAIQIPDDPKSIDPAALVPERLAANATVRFDGTALIDVAKWIQQHTGMNVFMNRQSLNAAQILPSEPVNDELKNSPVYLLLDRLRIIGVAWNVTNNHIHLTSLQDDSHLNTAQYNVGDLFDANFVADSLRSTIVNTVEPRSWEDAGGVGGIVVLGDVLFVRQSYRNHRLVAGLLAALRKHGRRTMIDDPPIHESIRQSLEKNLNVQFREKPLAAAVEELKTICEVDIRVDGPSLAVAKIPERLPVTFEFSQQTLRNALDLMLPTYGLAWQIRDGALWVTTQESVEEQAKTCVFDVRDLCRNASESDSLQAAIQSQADPESWDDNPGRIEFPISGSMVVYQTEKRVDDVLLLLENYRTALRASKRRVRPESDPKAIITRYYRMPGPVADDLEAMLPDLIQKDSWKSKNPAAAGTIQKIKSWSSLSPASTSKPAENAAAVQIPYSVLVIYQTRELHDQIPDILRRIEHGDTGVGAKAMGGGFGGGFFSVPTNWAEPSWAERP